MPTPEKSKKSRKSKKRSKVAPLSFMIIGHSCVEPEIPEFEIPSNVTYVTTGICGFSTYGTESLNETIIQRFFDNDPAFKTKDAEQILLLDPDYEPSPKEQFKQFVDEETGQRINDSTFIVVNRPRQTVLSSQYFPLFNYSLTENGSPVEALEPGQTGTWNACKSGLYILRPRLKKYKNVMSDPVVSIKLSSKEDPLENAHITVEQIRAIYGDSLYPTANAVIKQINRLALKPAEKPHIRFKNREDKCTLAEFETALNAFFINLTDIIKLIKRQLGSRQFRFYDPLCKEDCYSTGIDLTEKRQTQDARRRADEIQMQEQLLGVGLLKELRGGKTRINLRG
jgi:hypothetical protein